MAERRDPHAALVTGAASGIGLQIARRLLEAGHRTVLVDRDEAKLAEAPAGIGEDAFALPLDIGDKAAVDSVLSVIPDAFLPIDVLVNAGGHDPGGTTRFDRGDPDDWASAIETNLVAMMRVTRAVLPSMVARDYGDIVNIGSIAGLRIVPDMTAYNTSKAGVHAFTDQLRADLAETSIRVIEILPGLTRTDLIRKRYRGDAARAEKYYARFGMALEPDDIARTVLYALEAPRHMVLAEAVVLPSNRW